MKKYLLSIILAVCTLFGGEVQADEFNQFCDCADQSGFYVSGFGGVNWMNAKRNISSNYHPGFAGAVALGYQFDSYYTRLEAEVGYRRNKFKNASYYGEKIHSKGHTDALSWMANVYFYYPLECNVKPYVGIGAGYTTLRARHLVEGSSISLRESGFACQGIVGISTSITKNVDLGLEYRYFCARQNFHEQSVGLSLKYLF